MLAMEFSPALAGSGLCGSPGLLFSATCSAVARPNTTMSSSELAPSLRRPARRQGRRPRIAEALRRSRGGGWGGGGVEGG